MPCNCDGMDGMVYDSHNTELEKKWEEQKQTKEALCKLLTHIFFDTDDKELINNIKEKASRLKYWYIEHLHEDIKICEDMIQEYNLRFKFEEREKWENKRLNKIKQLKEIEKIISDEWSE